MSRHQWFRTVKNKFEEWPVLESIWKQHHKRGGGLDIRWTGLKIRGDRCYLSCGISLLNRVIYIWGTRWKHKKKRNKKKKSISYNEKWKPWNKQTVSIFAEYITQKHQQTVVITQLQMLKSFFPPFFSLPVIILLDGRHWLVNYSDPIRSHEVWVAAGSEDPPEQTRPVIHTHRC